MLTNFDIVAQAGGKNTAIDKPFAVTVTNGQILLQFGGVADYPWIKEREVRGSEVTDVSAEYDDRA